MRVGIFYTEIIPNTLLKLCQKVYCGQKIRINIKIRITQNKQSPQAVIAAGNKYRLYDYLGKLVLMSYPHI